MVRFLDPPCIYIHHVSGHC